METQLKISKGPRMEELLRNYYLNSGYYVVRGVKYRFEGNDITDVDLYLYGRSSSITRERINVDIKNKKSPQAFERILWANGLQKLLAFNKCIVATTDSRSVIQEFGQLHNTIILDGTFISKLRSNTYPNRFSEEDLGDKFANHISYKAFPNKDWRKIYDESKSKLLSELDFSGFNSELQYLNYFLEKILTDNKKREDATRLFYLILSHLLVIIDFILKDIAFLDTKEREKKLSDGFKFGNLGKIGVERIFTIARQIAGNRSSMSLMQSFDDRPIEILRDFFSKNENSKNLFNWAKDFERIGYTIEFVEPNSLDPALKGVLSLFLDFFKVSRKNFFDLFPKKSQLELPLTQN